MEREVAMPSPERKRSRFTEWAETPDGLKQCERCPVEFPVTKKERRRKRFCSEACANAQRSDSRRRHAARDGRKGGFEVQRRNNLKAAGRLRAKYPFLKQGTELLLRSAEWTAIFSMMAKVERRAYWEGYRAGHLKGRRASRYHKNLITLRKEQA